MVILILPSAWLKMLIATKRFWLEFAFLDIPPIAVTYKTRLKEAFCGNLRTWGKERKKQLYLVGIKDRKNEAAFK
jgi:hypothetical protein